MKVETQMIFKLKSRHVELDLTYEDAEDLYRQLREMLKWSPRKFASINLARQVENE